MKINNTKDIHFKPHYICIYGCSGSGKTSTVKSLPHDQTLIIDAESGLGSLDGTMIDHISLSKDDNGVFIAEEKRFDRLQEIMKFVQQEDTKKKYKFIFFDSLTEAGQNIQKTMNAKFQGFAAWNEYTKSMMDLLKFFRDIGHYTVIFTALEGRIEDDSGASFTYPDVGGKKAKEYLLPQFDEVFRLFIDAEKNRHFITRTTSKTQAKDRSGKLDELESPNLMQVINKMKGVK